VNNLVERCHLIVRWSAHEDVQHVRRVRLVMDALIKGLTDYAR
jgi:hypothetical protein